MRKTILSLALVGVAASVAIVTRSQIADRPALRDDLVGRDTQDMVRQDTQNVEQAPVTTPHAQAPGAGASIDTVRVAQNANVTAKPPERPYLRGVPNSVEAPTTEQSATAADVLRRASEAYAKVKSLRANFVQKRDNPLLGSTTTSRGTLYQRRPDRFLMKFSDPDGDVIVSDGRYFWIYYPSADPKQVLRAPASAEAAGGVDLQAQFLGDPLRRFSNTYHGTDTVAGRKTHVITMIPRENVGYKNLKVWIDAQDALVRRFVLTENNGVVMEIVLSNLTINPALGDDVFQFTPPTGAKIIENP